MKKLDPARVAALPPSKVLHPEAIQPKIEHPEDCVPEFEPSNHPEDPRRDELRKIPIDQAFTDFGLKIGHKTRQGYMVQCPDPTHGGDGDEKPSGSSVTDENTWCCHACTKRSGKYVGGDIFELGAWVLPGFDPETYKQQEVFPRLIDVLGDLYGLEKPSERGLIVRAVEPSVAVPGLEVTGVINAEQPKTAGQSQEPSSLGEVGPTVLAPVVGLPSAEDDENEAVDFSAIPRIDWRELVPPDTYLWHHMMAGEKDDLPLEYWFWNGFIGVGAAVGRDAWLEVGMPVYANLFVCFYGTTGQGKSRPIRALRQTIRKALPFSLYDPDELKGCFLIPDAESAQALVDCFYAPIHEDDDPKKPIIDYHHIRGLWVAGELADFIAKSHYSGSQLKPKLHQFHDGDDYISTKSRGHGTIGAEEPFLSMTTTTQPHAIRQLLQNNDRDSGFANRWIFVIGHSRPRRMDPPASDMTDCILPLQRIHEWCSGATGFQRAITLAPDAWDELQEYFYDKIQPIYSAKSGVEMLTRLEMTIKKLICILACNKLETVASLDTVRAALKLHDYLVACYEFLDRDLMTTEDQEFHEAIIRTAQNYFKRTKKPPTKSDIYLNIVKRHRDAVKIDRALRSLIELGLLAFGEPKSGRAGPVAPTFKVTRKATAAPRSVE